MKFTFHDCTFIAFNGVHNNHNQQLQKTTQTKDMKTDNK